MRGWQAETQRSSVAACQPSYLYCGAHSTQTLRARVGLHISLASWANKDHLSGWGFLSQRQVASQKILGRRYASKTRKTTTKQTKKNESQNNTQRLRALGYSLRNDKTLIIWYAELRARCATAVTHDTDKPKKAERPWTTLCHFHKISEKKMKGSQPSLHFRSVRDSACLPACFSGTLLPTWHITRALHWCRQWAIPASSMIAMIWVGKSITWPPGKRRTPGRSLAPRLSRNTGLFSASIYKPPSSLSYGAHNWLGIV